MINFNKKKNKTKNGFTLVETLVALFIFSISVLTVMLALSRGITGTIYAKNKIIAEYLTQEGIEYFRNMRDTYVLNPTAPQNGWAGFYTKVTDYCLGDGCYFNNDEIYLDGTMYMELTACTGPCPNLKYHSSSGKYDYSTLLGENTTFSRKMIVEELDTDNIKITSEVTWKSGSKTNTSSLSENLSNWIE